MTKKHICNCGGNCDCTPKKEKSKEERISKLIEAHAEKVNGLWDDVEKVRDSLNAFEDAVTDIQNDFDMLFDDVQFILNS